MIKITIFLSLGLHKGHPRYKREALSSQKRTSSSSKQEISKFFYFCGSFFPSLIRIQIPNTDPDTQPWFSLQQVRKLVPSCSPKSFLMHTGIWGGVLFVTGVEDHTCIVNSVTKQGASKEFRSQGPPFNNLASPHPKLSYNAHGVDSANSGILQ